LDIFSESHGRLSVVAGQQQRAADALQLLSGSWAENDDWPKIRGMECRQAHNYTGTPLYCALYLTELLSRLLPRYEPHADIFQAYHKTLQGLANGGMPDPWLRLFEVQLLAMLGYGFSWREDEKGNPLTSSDYYEFLPRHGFRSAQAGFRGQDILAFAERRRDEPGGWKVARQILRQAFDDLLERPLVSRELIQVNR